MFDQTATWDEGKPPSDTSRVSRLFEQPLQDKWACDVWVRPQSQELGKIYLAREYDAIVKFLDPEMARKGERAMYVEIHLLPKKMQEVDRVLG
ncbi:hypothetical protein CLAFUW4_02399 [Fulvia fulva]|uniref:Uncharacterized protein n=1 Tax=Passalora fulva TaxID=5499 RepID=A0A9Q8LAP1_PASFU|nr:uncharacterized protein CLAFUR5_02387 [Fulvia fulva]KAK4631996.1 hypothetical protein CLAFUR4_02394 [Fulvia fulva]KAK4633365.1 hypothetical protein CLAFUR0_02398 [Fulvia fulva]UJO13957.1 hypothetical protein CLAFUR5_02387 [Fulvia fulva]WPV10943.1 hypothetical protein CLAFUW4_02399 [Fulvia fulva]WPV25866.1 hypothetical protein CLAFUW7_02399 [Fulvia fulva]